MDEPRNRVSLVLRWSVALIVLACTVGSLFWNSTREPGRESPEQAEAVAIKALYDIRIDLLDYALTFRDKYPPTLAALGGRAAVLAGTVQDAGYSVEYVPQSAKADGSFRGFVLLARTDKLNCRNFYLDESGQARATAEARPANIEDPPI